MQSALECMVCSAGPANGGRIVIVCYLDDSGTSGPFVTMAGFIAPLADWSRFEKSTRQVFRKEKLKIFHAREFEASDNEFAGWSSIRKTRFVHQWIDAAQPHVTMGIAVSLPMATYKKRQKESKVSQHNSVYAQCFGGIIENILKTPLVWEQAVKHGLSFVIERGNKNDQNVLELYNKLADQEPLDGVLRGLTFCEKDSCYAVQFADFLAFYCRRHADRFDDPRRPQMNAYLHLAKEQIKIVAQLAEDFGVTGSE